MGKRNVKRKRRDKYCSSIEILLSLFVISIIMFLLYDWFQYQMTRPQMIERTEIFYENQNRILTNVSHPKFDSRLITKPSTKLNQALSICAKFEKAVRSSEPKDVKNLAKLTDQPSDNLKTHQAYTSSILPSTRDAKKSEMKHRTSVLNFGCQLEEFFIQKKFVLMPFQKLTRLQKTISNLDQAHLESFQLDLKSPTRYPDGENGSTRSIHFMNDSKLFACLPLKTGTTNWQKSLGAAQYHLQTGRYLDPNFVHGVYKLLPRYYLSTQGQLSSVMNELNQGLPDGINCMQEILKAKSEDKNNLSWMNVRHPFARLLSAWRNKFSKTFNSRDLYMKKYSKIIESFYDSNEYIHPDYLVSFPGFLKMIISTYSNSERLVNTHWKKYFDGCSPCAMRYQYITKSETSSSDADFIFSLNNFSEITYLPGEYASASVGLSDVIKWYQNVTNTVLQDLYKIYFPDFALFEYNIDDFLQ